MTDLEARAKAYRDELHAEYAGFDELHLTVARLAYLAGARENDYGDGLRAGREEAETAKDKRIAALERRCEAMVKALEIAGCLEDKAATAAIRGGGGESPRLVP